MFFISLFLSIFCNIYLFPVLVLRARFGFRLRQFLFNAFLLLLMFYFSCLRSPKKNTFCLAAELQLNKANASDTEAAFLVKLIDS